MAIIQKWSSLLTVFVRDTHDSLPLLLTAAVLALPCSLKMCVPHRRASLIGYVMMLALGFSSPGFAFGQEPYSMTGREVQRLQGGPSAHPRLVGQVEDISETAQKLPDGVKEEGNAVTAFNPNDPTNIQTLTTLNERAKLFEIKAQFGALCAKGLQLAQLALASPTVLPTDEEMNEWDREVNLLVYTWFTEEQKAEWFSSGKEVLDYLNIQGERLRGMPNNNEKVALGNRLFALLMNAEVEALEKLSNDLGTRITLIKAPRSSD